jgi:putative alpha-1,2-mannosidase
MGAPYFKKMTVHLPKGKKLVVNAPENSDANRYVEQLKVNGKNYERNYVKHKDLLKGMTMNYVMSSTPNTERGTSPKAAPYSFSKEK